MKNKTRYFFLVSYKGTHFSGWQRQADARTIQEVIENTLSKILGMDTLTIIGCGRTDKGVHASYFVFHTDLEPIQIEPLKQKLHFSLPPTIRIHQIVQPPLPLHARFDAIERSYTYYFHLLQNPFFYENSLFISEQPNIIKMKELAAWFTKQSEFKSFCKSPDKHNTTICDLTTIDFYASPCNTHFKIVFKSNRFLRGMIRILTQMLLDIGLDLMTLEDVIQRYTRTDSEKVPPLKLAPAHGLYLSNVAYDTHFFDTTYPQSPFEDREWKQI